MAKPQYLTLSKRIIDRLSVDDKDALFWDRDLPGFGIRVYPSGAKVYVVQSRAFGRSKRVTVGRHGEVSADQARKEATRIIGRIKAGESPVAVEAPPEPTVRDLAERYQREYVEMHCKPATVSHYAVMLRKHIVPALGKLLVAEVERKHIMEFQYGLRDMPTVANRGVDILVKMFGLADAWGWRPSGKNPCQFVRRYKVEKHHERFLTPEELYRLGRALDTAPTERLASVHAAAAIRLLVLTGCRRNEILGLRWEDVDFQSGEMRFGDSKTGARVAPLPPPAVKLLEGLSRVPGNPWVFPGRKKGSRQRNIQDSWGRIRQRAGLEGVRLHDLRHSYASRALALGESLSMIGELLGHRKVQTTARYAHLARDSVRTSTARVAESIGADILPQQEK